MKHWLLVVALICLGSTARAQSAPAQSTLPPLATVSGTAADPAPAGIPGWYKLNWTPAGSAWQFGLDGSSTVGACLERELHDGQWLAGPCRDVLLLAKNKSVAFHLGAAAMSNAEHGNTAFQLRLGFNMGPATQSVVVDLLSRLPLAENLANWTPPPFLQKIGNATTVDFMGGPRPFHDAGVNGLWTYGVGVKVDVPLDVVYGWLKAGL